VWLCGPEKERGTRLRAAGLRLKGVHGLYGHTRRPAPLPIGNWQFVIPFEQIKPDFLLWGCFRSSFASSSTPAGCLLQLKHGLDEGARGAKSGYKKGNRR
jgi:hypothetical protein